MFCCIGTSQAEFPAAKGSPEYNRALQQVRGKGIPPDLMGGLPASYSNTTSEASKRTPEETLIGIYWAYDGVRNLGTPPRLYNQIARKIAELKNTGPSANDRNARLFALMNAAMGDAGILAWDDKYDYDVWRPVLGIREHDASMGPAAPAPGDSIDADCDPEWRPLVKASWSALISTAPIRIRWAHGYQRVDAALNRLIHHLRGCHQPVRRAEDAIPFGQEYLLDRVLLVVELSDLACPDLATFQLSHRRPRRAATR